MMERHREKERKDIVGKKNCTQKWESRVAKIYDKNIFSKKKHKVISKKVKKSLALGGTGMLFHFSKK